ncbi:uncharacterized protein LOC143280032 isoform X2 [Babylonia areolata]|uniref:uncharacterized protein LOC143280032 isoform X2 n=1 Tax=Babylonia areolata TaxID=304850 RepID=UPI003FD2B764
MASKRRDEGQQQMPKEAAAVEHEWSDPCSFTDVVRDLKKPVIVKLEDGYRGRTEIEAFSLGDLMALEGKIVAKGRTLVLAHFMTETEADRRTDEDATYRSLMTLPFERLPRVPVRVCLDPEGMLYQNFLTAHFPNCNWKGKQQQQQLLETLDDDDYDTIYEITPVLSKTALTPTPAPVSQTKTPRRVPPKPPTQKSSSLDDQTSRRTPPPLPARTVSEGGARKDDDDDYEKINEITLVLSKTALTATPAPVSQTKTPPCVPPKPPTQKSSSLDDQTSRRTPPPLPARTVSEEGARKDGIRAPVDGQQLTPPPRLPPRLNKSPPPTSRARVVAAGEPEILFPSERAEQKAEESDEEYLDLVDSNDYYMEVVEHKTPAPDQKDRKQIAGNTCSSARPEQKGLKMEHKEEQKVYWKPKQQQKDEPKVTAPQNVAPVKPTAQVQPLPPTRPPMLPRSVTSPRAEESDGVYEKPLSCDLPLDKMSCKQLCARLEVCGMRNLATTCANELIDGSFLCALSSEQLRKPPFCLTDFEINPKLNRVKSGWIPK